MSEPKSTNLYLTEGASDKVYQAQLEQDAAGWSVNFQYGRRGKPLRSGNKATGIAYAQALKIFDKLISSKTKKGYTEEEHGQAFTSAEYAGQATGFRPQLLNEISVEEALALGDNWLVQEKHDGERRGLQWDGAAAVYSNRRGLGVDVDVVIHEAFTKLGQALGPMEVDAEDMGDHIVIFDVLQHPSMGSGTFRERAEILHTLQQASLSNGLYAQLKVDIPQPMSEFIASRLDDLREGHAEGFVLRNADSHYVADRPASGGDALKVKFWADCSCRVTEGRVGKRSVGLELLDANNEWQPVGNVTIGGAREIPSAGTIIDVRYLYAYEGGSLFQPTFIDVRTDVTDDECRMDRLKFHRPTTEAEPCDFGM